MYGIELTYDTLSRNPIKCHEVILPLQPRLCSHLNVLMFPLSWGCSEDLNASRCFFKLSFNLIMIGMAISPTGGVFSYLPHHLDLASEDSVGHSTCMSVLACRRAIMGSIVQPKRSCLGAATGTAESPHRWGK